MFIDFLPLLLINMSAGLFVLAGYASGFPVKEQERSWGAAFLAVGLVAFIGGWNITMAWPLPGSYNISFGEMSVLFGTLYLVAAVAIASGQSLLPLGIYAALAGITAMVVGWRIVNLNLTQAPLMTAGGFILTGFAGAFMFPTLLFRKQRSWKIIFVVLLIAGALFWAYSGFMSYWFHLDSFSKWKPVLMR